MTRETAVVYRSWLDAIKELPESERGVAALALFEYAIYGETNHATGIARAIVTMAKPIIDSNNQRYENGCKGGAYGALGGRPKKPQENPEKTPKKPQRNPKETPVFSPPTPPSIYVNDNDISSLSLSLSPYGEKEESRGGVTATERENIFSVFYFRNCKRPEYELERFINHYETSGWCRNGSNRPVKNKVALSKSWKFEDQTPRYDGTTMEILGKIHLATIELGDNGRIFVFMLHKWLQKISLTEDNRPHIFMTDRAIMDAMEQEPNKSIFISHIGTRWKYAVAKKQQNN